MQKGMWTARSVAVRSTVIIAALLTCGFGTACYIVANLGNDPFTAFIQGLSFVLGVSYGVAAYIVNGAFFVLVLILNRRLINIGTFLGVLLAGVISDFFIWAMHLAAGPSPAIGVRVAILILGIGAVGFGVGLYQAAHMGAAPSDAFNQVMAAKLKIPLRWERMAYDAIMLGAGWLMGGVVHVGTVFSVLATGPIMAPTFERFTSIVDRWAGTPGLNRPAAPQKQRK